MPTRKPKPRSQARPAKRGQARRTADEDVEDAAATSKSGPRRVSWTSNRTDRLLDWLEQNVEDRHKLFSDSAQDAREENRRRRTAKNVKTGFYLKMAEYIFSIDEDERIRDDIKTNGAKKYCKAVENRIAR